MMPRICRRSWVTKNWRRSAFDNRPRLGSGIQGAAPLTAVLPFLLLLPSTYRAEAKQSERADGRGRTRRRRGACDGFFPASLPRCHS